MTMWPSSPVDANERDLDRLAADATPSPRERLPLPWLLFVLATAAWWPLQSFWQSDDWIAVHYAHDLDRALADFAGNQYHLPGVVWFYRPLITFSFWLEQAVFGADPLVAHVVNTLAHATSAVLLGALGARLVGPLRGFLAGLLWALAPTHAGSILWAVGRVDSHTTVWVLATLLLVTRWVDGRRRALAFALVTAAGALCSKESAMVLPGLVAVTAFAAARTDRRLQTAIRATLPFALLLVGYFALRYAVLGRFLGGYVESPPLGLDTLIGLGAGTARALNPLPLCAPGDAAPPGWLVPLGYLPPVVALAWLLFRRRHAHALLGLAAYAIAVLPAVHSWGDWQNPESLRLYYLPFAAMALWIASAGPLPGTLMLAVFALPLVQVHRDYFGLFDDTRQIHERVQEFGSETDAETLFVHGLPRTNRRGTAVAYHLGVDRILRPPFVPAAEQREVLALRPLAQDPLVRTLPYGESSALPFDLPTMQVSADGRTAVLLPRAGLQPLQLENLGPEVVATRDLLALHEGSRVHRIRVSVRAQHYRVSLFTAGGYLTVLLPDRAGPDLDSGQIDVLELLTARHVEYDAADEHHVAFALATPTALDLSLRFPLLVEAGRMVNGQFTATHANRTPLRLGFDRGYPRFIAGE